MKSSPFQENFFRARSSSFFLSISELNRMLCERSCLNYEPPRLNLLPFFV